MAQQTGEWALILGASSGFGAAAAREFARAGYHIAGVHLGRRAALPDIAALRDEIRAQGVEERFYNGNAADEGFRGEVITELGTLLMQRGELGRMRVLLHSLAFGALRPYTGEQAITSQQFAMTFEVMANSLVYWTQDLLAGGLMNDGARIFAMTSAGGHRVWRDYGAISGAKALLEAHIRQLAVELAPRRITANAIQAGVTDTPALRKIPSFQAMIERGVANNPHGRITEPIDVAQALVALAVPGTGWITGNVIRVDGGEDIVA